ncbi:E7 [Capreolus capreolus papillomavirus 1]|uniref:Protein E7 n=1 Tax=Capreolus capreolus papillomavirus 1 TaxID=470214 RepID=B3ST91_9PAPI|nr:E7 [Capreolus capreolus papillomavirus 1]ABV27561.1 E7 [Capreolus capreolus papillomavirus 1]QNR09262.1 E7 [Capreolus capreolus papillomavirus 1]QNR09270.1 E7 [Capreolus capreolus papillomavirus 1]QNR09278.1 E7 [Capreolus capreolus papillomavirus 1]QNR09286.1 E7 [Capreolus capreolus papillomavirus 1]
MVHGPNTSKVLPNESLIPLTLHLKPLKPEKPAVTVACSLTHEQPRPSRPPPKPPRMSVYYVGVCCGCCEKKLDFAVRTSQTSITSFHALLLEDLDILCALCEGKTRHG